MGCGSSVPENASTSSATSSDAAAPTGKNRHASRQESLRGRSATLTRNSSIRVDSYTDKAQEEDNYAAGLETATFKAKYKVVSKTPLGKGAFAHVYHVQDKVDNSDWACKIVDKNHISIEDGELRAIRWEAEAQMLCHEPGVVELRESFECDDGGDMDKGFMFMVMEIMRGGELFDRIMQKSFYSEADAEEVVRGLATALQNCHLHQVVHLDLKPENVLYMNKEGMYGGDVVKICDFGISRTLDPEHPAGGELADGKCAPDGRLHGTPGYISPEMILQQPFDEKCDVWQLGVLTYILLSGIPPFEEPPELEGTSAGMDAMFEFIKDGDYFPFDQYQPFAGEENPWTVCSEEAKDFIIKTLTPDPNQRPDMKEVLLHPWIANAETRVAVNRKRNLNGTQQRIAKLAARRRFKRGIRKLIVMQKISGGFGDLVKAAAVRKGTEA